eukprot:TRINITY_DN32895_c0_g1_i1.p1 TRINITY_DN32895_c0_g1~~TRINITY_DN32895_c0_g1_i1.p1  ORF type:complete len:252 (+),score=33.01 TRINITY_DN32895_c0_g1_i1:190-945(+)
MAPGSPTYVRRSGSDHGMCRHVPGTVFPDSIPYNINGATCVAATGACPSFASPPNERCADVAQRFCTAQGARSDTIACTQEWLTCWLCIGGNLSLDMQSSSCSANYIPGERCGLQTCNNNGCCNPDGSCTCFDTDEQGHFAGHDCSSCAPLWTSGDGGDCRSPQLSLTLLFGGEPTAAPAVIPYMIMLILYVLFAVVRKRWSHEQPAPLTADQVRYFRQSTEEKLRSLRGDPVYIPPRNHHSRGMRNKLKT